MSISTETLKIMQDVGAVITNRHFVYTSGMHGSAYINKDALYPHTQRTSDLCYDLAFHFYNHREKVEVVTAPAIGGVILSQWVAFHLSKLTKREVFGVYAEKAFSGDGFVIKRGYDKLVEGKKTLVVEDILNTGGSAKQVVEATRDAGGIVVGLAALCNRGGVKPEDVGNPPELFALCDIKMEAWDEAECPLCARGVPINTEFGKGREYLARKQQK